LAFTTEPVNQKRHKVGWASNGHRRWDVRKGKSVGPNFAYDAFRIANNAIREKVHGIRVPDNIYRGHRISSSLAENYWSFHVATAHVGDGLQAKDPRACD